MSDPNTPSNNNPVDRIDYEQALKTKLAREAMKEVTEQLKWRFWAVFAFVALLGYFGGYELIKTSARDATRDSNHKQIARELVATNAFNDEVMAQSAPKIAGRIIVESKPAYGASIDCTVGHKEWNNDVASTAKCPANTFRVGGGCEFTCMGSAHEISVPGNDNTWTCRQIARGDQTTDGDAQVGRKFRAVALCASLRAVQ